MEQFELWEAKQKEIISAVRVILDIELSDEPEALIKQLAEVEKWYAHLIYLLAKANAFLDISEANRLERSDIDVQRRLVNVTPEKSSNPRMLPISNKLIGMLQRLPKKGTRIWASTLTSLKTNFYLQRKRVASRLNDPSLLKIKLHTFRHWKATMEYHKTKDILHVQQMLGHRDIKSTMIYINLEQAIFHSPSNEYHTKSARNSEEATKLLEVGFDFVCTTPDGTMLFRKPRHEI